MAPLLSYQPFKAVYTVCVLIFCIPYFTAFFILYQVKTFRPHPQWEVQTSIVNKIMQTFYQYATAVRLRPVVHSKLPKLKERFVIAQPGPSEMYISVLQENLSIKPLPMPAIWFPRSFEAEEDNARPIILHLQGGAYVHAADPRQTALFPTSLFQKHFDALTFFAQYRLSRTEDTRFPAALQDAVTFYRYLLDLGINSANIIISGDSAGGNLVLALARYIEDNKNVLPVPRGIMAWSPWVDLREKTIEKYRTSPRRHTDFVSANLGSWGREAFVPTDGNEKKFEAYISAIEHPFACRTPLFIHAGTAELLYDEIRIFANAMDNMNGNMLAYFETENAPHDLILAGKGLGLAREAEIAVDAARGHFDSVLQREL